MYQPLSESIKHQINDICNKFEGSKVDYVYRCKKCGQTFDYKAAGHSIEVINQGKKMLKACRGELEQIELMAEIPLVKSKILNKEKK